MSLLSTMLAFVAIPLVRRTPNEVATLREHTEALTRQNDKLVQRCKELVYSLGQSEGRADALQVEVVRLGEEKDAWARAYEAARDRQDEERERGLQDRAQTRHWRSQADYWERAYTDLAVPNQWDQNEVRQRRAQLLQLQQNEGRQRVQNTMGPAQLQNGQVQQLTPQQLALAQQPQQQGQNLAQQNLWQQPTGNLGWVCTCVPGRSALLSGSDG